MYNEGMKPRRPQTVDFSELRGNCSRMLDLVEGGCALKVRRHGRPIAWIVPWDASDRMPGTAPQPVRRPFPRWRQSGASLSQAILEERDTER